MTEHVTIAVDAMGGHHAPEHVLEAVGRASRELSGVYFLVVGDETRIIDRLNAIGHNPERITVVHARDVISPAEPAREALERKPDASIALACKLVARGEADAVIGSGHPGAAVLSALAHFEMIDGIQRAALASVYPTPRVRGESQDPFSLILDVGATLRAAPEHLVSFALMGSAYSRIVSKIEEPRVGLLSTSPESQIGVPEVVEAARLLRDHPGIYFYGNIEGHEIPRGVVDVVVCEGFVGDVTIKLLEGVSEAAIDLARAAYERKFVYKLGIGLLSEGLKKVKSVIDFEEYGGAPLLGLDRVVILAHPRSQSRAMFNAIKLATKNVRADLPSTLAELVAQPDET